MLASEYGWPPDHIMHNVYPDELFHFVRAISRRQTDSMIAQLRIISNPHIADPSDRKQLFDELAARKRSLDDGLNIPDEKFDRAAFEALRRDLGQGSKSIGVKL